MAGSSAEIPDFQTLMLPVLRSGKAGEASIKAVVARFAEAYQLTDQQHSALLPPGTA